MNRFLILILVGALAVAVQGCVVFAPPAPMVTFGGPQTAPEGQSEVAAGIGSGVVLFDDAHTGGMGYLLRYKYGITGKYDLGVDAIGVTRSDKATYTIKFANRYQLAPNWRLEGGLGIADDSDGKSLNGDAGITWGTLPQNKPWNLYSTFRLGAAKGYPGDIFGEGDEAPPNTFFTLLNVGTQGRISDQQKFIFEGGYGYVFPNGEKAGPVLYLSGGVLFYIGNAKD